MSHVCLCGKPARAGHTCPITKMNAELGRLRDERDATLDELRARAEQATEALKQGAFEGLASDAVLRAEVERLRAELDMCDRSKLEERKGRFRVEAELRNQESATQQLSTEVMRLAAQLAAANALLHKANRHVQCLDVHDEIRALGVQPAPPRCQAHDAPLANLGFFKCGCRYVQPAASERHPPRTIPDDQLPPIPCTAAERRVLDAMARIGEQDVKAWLLEAGPEYEELGRAELSRREAKP